MKNITKEELKTILEQHKLWLDSNGKEGKCADLTRADLTGADLSGANLRCAYLTGADLYGANLRCTDLTGVNLANTDLRRAALTGADLSGAALTCANLSGATLYGANLSDVDLTGTDLTGADLSGTALTCACLTDANLIYANLTYANLYCADLTGADLYGAKLYGANLRGADLRGADLRYANLEWSDLTDTILDEKEQCRKGIVLTEPMIGYKKARGCKIITLEIPIGAKVFSINNSKRRTNKCKVIDMQGKSKLSSCYDNNFKYHVGDEIEIEDFDERYNVECGEGIHFFSTREEAEEYIYY